MHRANEIKNIFAGLIIHAQYLVQCQIFIPTKFKIGNQTNLALKFSHSVTLIEHSILLIKLIII